ncbi:MAG TPA: DUF4338 domain-containing protein [Verrucomicrobiota bacterium]|nr:DUF4338 domain-containing protein [Verrucomicrobiota bacterium]
MRPREQWWPSLSIPATRATPQMAWVERTLVRRIVIANDQSIEWSSRQRQLRLHLVAQDSRFVILAERGALPNLATRALSLCVRRLSDEWQTRYGHPLLLVKSFLDRQLFRATAYQAGEWQARGRRFLSRLTFQLTRTIQLCLALSRFRGWLGWKKLGINPED